MREDVSTKIDGVEVRIRERSYRVHGQPRTQAKARGATAIVAAAQLVRRDFLLIDAHSPKIGDGYGIIVVGNVGAVSCRVN